MMRKNRRIVLKVDFSENSPLKTTLLTDLMQKPFAPLDMKEDASMKKGLRYSTRMLLCGLCAAILLSGVALAAMKTFSLGPFVTYTHKDGSAMRSEIDRYVNDNRSVWEGKLFDKDGKPIDNLADYMVGYSNGEYPYALYDSDGKLSGLTNIDGRVVLAGPDDNPSKTEDQWAHFDTFSEVRPYLHTLLDPVFPAILPEGYELTSFSIPKDEEGRPYSGTEYLTVSYSKQEKILELDLRLMNENTAFETSSTASLDELIINGRNAISDGGMLSMMVGDILYTFNPRNSFVTMEELVKMAESIQE